MFAPRYFAKVYFPGRYFPPVEDGPVPPCSNYFTAYFTDYFHCPTPVPEDLDRGDLPADPHRRKRRKKPEDEWQWVDNPAVTIGPKVAYSEEALREAFDDDDDDIIAILLLE